MSRPMTTPSGRRKREPSVSWRKICNTPAASFDALLLWDVLDYLEPSLAKLMIGQLTDLLRPGGVVFAMFHSKSRRDFSGTGWQIRIPCRYCQRRRFSPPRRSIRIARFRISSAASGP